MIGLFEPVCAPWQVDGIPTRLLVRPDRSPTGTAWRPYVERAMGRVPIVDGHRHPHVLLRPGELHPRPVADRRRGAGAAQLLRRRRPELDRHPHRRRARPGARPLDPGPAAPTSTSPAMQHRPAARRTRRTPSTAARAPSSRSAWCTSATTRGGRCRRPAAPRSRRSTTGWPPRGAHFKDVSGWEGADWYAPAGVDAGSRAADVGPAARTGRTGRPSTRRPATGVIVMDMSFMSKFAVQGRDAGRLLEPALGQRRRRRPPATITYTQWLNDGGTLEADLTVTKLDDERFWVVATDTAHRHVETWMRRHVRRAATRSSPTSRPATPSSTSRARGRGSCCRR